MPDNTKANLNISD